MDRESIEQALQILDDPIVGLLHAPLWRRCLELSLLACDHDQDGLLPPLAECAAHLHLSGKILKKTLLRLSKLGWMHETPQGWVATRLQEKQVSPGRARTHPLCPQAAHFGRAAQPASGRCAQTGHPLLRLSGRLIKKRHVSAFF